MTGQALDILLDGRADGHIARLTAKVLKLPLDGRYVVIAHRNGPSDALPSSPGGVRVLWRRRAKGFIGVAVLGTASITSIVDDLPPGRIGVSLVVEGLERLALGRRLAELAADTVTGEHGVVCLEHQWISTLLVSSPDLAAALSVQVLAPLLALDRETRDLLLDTFLAWASAGSATNAAPALHCHRNTVLNRLRRLEKLTGRRLSAPTDLVELTLAVHAFRVHPPQLTYQRSRST